jgi:DNA-binding response OmpR family regulator
MFIMAENKKAAAGASSGGQIQFKTNQPHRILVVSQDPYIRHFSAELLIRHGYIVNAAEDGATGWEELQANSYDLLIAEPYLPKITGVKLIRKLRAARLAIPVVIVADKLSIQELARTPSHNIAATLLKPLPFDVLLDTINIILWRFQSILAPSSAARKAAEGRRTPRRWRVCQRPPDRAKRLGVLQPSGTLPLGTNVGQCQH